MAAGGAGIARPGFDQPGIEIFGERAQDAETVRFGRVERQDEQHGVIDPLDGLVEHERGIARHAIGNAVPGELERVRGEREPVVAMAQGFGVAFLRVELARHGEGLPWRFVEGDAVAGYVGEEGTAARELVVHVHQRMHDEIDGCGEVPGDGQLAHQMIVGDRPPCLQIGEGVGVDDDEQVIIGNVTAGAILDPIAACVGAEQDQLEDAAALALVRELGFDGILKFIEQDAGDPFQLAALDGGQMVEAGPHRHPIVAGEIASVGSASG